MEGEERSMRAADERQGVLPNLELADRGCDKRAGTPEYGDSCGFVAFFASACVQSSFCWNSYYCGIENEHACVSDIKRVFL